MHFVVQFFDWKKKSNQRIEPPIKQKKNHKTIDMRSWITKFEL